MKRSDRRSAPLDCRLRLVHSEAMATLDDLTGRTVRSISFDPAAGVVTVIAHDADGATASIMLRMFGVIGLDWERSAGDPQAYTEVTAASATSGPEGFVVRLLLSPAPSRVMVRCGRYSLDG